ncbi:MAG: hypothetical protein ABI881_18185 [Betaproteobacteria bacterium]
MNLTSPAFNRIRASRMLRTAASLVHPWQPIVAFASMALLYLLLDALLGTHLDFPVQAIAIASLFVATPVLAMVCRRIASPHGRAIVAGAGGLLCAGLWMALIAIYFNSDPDIQQHQPADRIIRYGSVSILMYASLIWLACGGARGSLSERDAAVGDSKQSRFVAFAAGVAWLLVAAALTLSPLIQADYINWWGPMSLFAGPVAGVICALNAIRAARGAAELLRWLAVAAAIALIAGAAYISGFFLMVSGWLH